VYEILLKQKLAWSWRFTFWNP